VENQCNSHSGSLKLNVLFHGAFAFDQTTRPGRIRALIPQMDHHVYRAGSWLAETELRGGNCQPRIYELEGVKPGHQKLNTHVNLTVKLDPDGRRETPFAIVDLPLPAEVTSMLVTELPSDAFSIRAELVNSGDIQRIATLHVFTYEIEYPNALYLKADDGDGHYWEPSPVGPFVNLHIFSAEDHYHKPSNAKEDMNLCLALLPGVQTRLVTDQLQVSGVLASPAPPPGVVEEETETLALRTQRMAYLGRLIRQGADAGLAWAGIHPLDGEAQACGPCVG
jgi:hypothetical protein